MKRWYKTFPPNISNGEFSCSDHFSFVEGHNKLYVHIKWYYVSLGKYIGITGPLTIFPWSLNICSWSLCYVFIFLLLTFKWNWTKNFLVGRWIKIKLIEAKGACDSVWQSPSVAASSSQMSGWCNQKQSACDDKRLGVNVAHKGDYTFLLFCFLKRYFCLELP